MKNYESHSPTLESSFNISKSVGAVMLASLVPKIDTYDLIYVGIFEI